VVIDIVATDSRRYRYAYHRSSWLVAGKADPPAPSRLYTHPDTPVSCDALRKQVISFEKVKLTNNEMDKNGQVIIVCSINCRRWVYKHERRRGKINKKNNAIKLLSEND
jgi:hypothetical protein